MIIGKHTGSIKDDVAKEKCKKCGLVSQQRILDNEDVTPDGAGQ
jgi:hypothetical protein